MMMMLFPTLSLSPSLSIPVSRGYTAFLIGLSSCVLSMRWERARYLVSNVDVVVAGLDFV